MPNTSFLNSSPSVGAAGTSAKRVWTSVYTASVVSTQDPLRQSRVTLKIPQVLGTSTSNWAVPVGFSPVIPKVGQIVWASFLGGDINHPLYTYASTTNTATAVPGMPGVPVISGTTVDNSTFTNSTITAPTITDGTMSSTDITNPTVTNGTFNNPAIHGGEADGMTSVAANQVLVGGATGSAALEVGGDTNMSGLLKVSQLLLNGATGLAALEVTGNANISGIVEIQTQLLVNGATGAESVEVTGNANFSGKVIADQVLLNGASTTADLGATSGHITGNLVVGSLNGSATLPLGAVSTVTASVPSTYTSGGPTTTQGIITALEGAVNGLIARLQSVGIIP